MHRFPAPVAPLLGALLLLLAACGGDAGRSPEEVLARVDQLLGDGKHQPALVALKAATQQHPDDAALRRRLAELYDRFGDAEAAQKEIDRALASGLPPAGTEALRAHILLMRARPGDALKLLDGAADLARSTELLTLYGSGLMAQNRLDDARAKFEAALAIDPRYARALVGLAAIAERRQDSTAARDFAARAVAAGPEVFEAQIAQGQALVDADPQASRAAFAAAGKLNPFSVFPPIGEARALIAQKQPAEAEKLLATARKRFPKNVAVIYYQGAAAYLAEKPEQAIQHFRDVLARVPTEPLSHYYLGILLYRAGQLEQAEDHIRRFSAAYPRHLPARKLLAAIQIKRDKPRDALATLTEGLPEEVADAELLNLRAGAYLATGQVEQGMAALEESYARAPEDSSTRASLVIAKLRAGQGDEAVELLTNEIGLDKDVTQNSLLLVYSHLAQKQWDKALATAAPLLDSGENTALLHNAMGIAEAGKERPTEARRHFEAAAEAAPHQPLYRRNVVLFDLAAKDYVAAQQGIDLLLAASPDNPLDLSLAGRLALVRQDRERAREFYLKAVAAGARAPEPYTFLASDSLERGDDDEALRLAGNGLALAPQDVRLLLVFAEAAAALGRTDDALIAARSAGKLYPQDHHAALLAGRAYLDKGALDQAEAELNRARDLAPENLDVAAALSRLAALRGDHAAAQDAVERLAKLEGESARVLLQRADLARRQGQFDTAVRNYQAALAVEENTSTLTLLRDALLDAGRGEEALQAVEAFAAKYPDDLQARAARAYTLENLGRTAEAVEAYEAVLEVDPKSLAVLNNLALLLADETPARALGLAETAYGIAPGNGRIVAMLGWVEFKNGHTERALTLLGEAAKLEPDLGDIHYRRALVLAQGGDKRTAAEALTAALKDAELPEREAAQRLLDSLQR